MFVLWACFFLIYIGKLILFKVDLTIFIWLIFYGDICGNRFTSCVLKTERMETAGLCFDGIQTLWDYIPRYGTRLNNLVGKYYQISNNKYIWSCDRVFSE